MPSDTHPLIALFQAQAELLDLAQNKATLSDAISLLASWMDVARGRLTEDDLVVLGEIGGILYRDGLARRLP